MEEDNSSISAGARALFWHAPRAISLLLKLGLFANRNPRLWYKRWRMIGLVPVDASARQACAVHAH
jgi:hypothetical protein